MDLALYGQGQQRITLAEPVLQRLRASPGLTPSALRYGRPPVAGDEVVLDSALVGRGRCAAGRGPYPRVR